MEKELEEQIAKQIITNIPQLSTNRVKNYTSMLLEIYKKLNGTGGISFFEKEKNEIIYLFDFDLQFETNLSCYFPSLHALTLDENYLELDLNELHYIHTIDKINENAY